MNIRAVCLTDLLLRKITVLHDDIKVNNAPWYRTRRVGDIRELTLDIQIDPFVSNTDVQRGVAVIGSPTWRKDGVE
jgi:hypothetical protein